MPGIPTFTADFLLDTTRTAISLILSGALEKYDGIRFILAHAGGFVPYVAHRILLTTLRDEPKWKLAGLALNRERVVAQRMRRFHRFYFDVALSSTPAAFPSLLAVADLSKILFGTDFPFAPAPAVRYMRQEYDALDLTPDLRAGIDRKNALTLFPRLADQGASLHPSRHGVGMPSCTDWTATRLRWWQGSSTGARNSPMESRRDS